MALRHLQVNFGRLRVIVSDSAHLRPYWELKRHFYLGYHRSRSENRGYDSPSTSAADVNKSVTLSRSRRFNKQFRSPASLAQEQLRDRVEATGSIDEVLGLVVVNPDMEAHHLLAIARRLVSFQKLPECKIEPKELHNHPGFVAFCHKLRKKAPHFGHVSELVTCLKTIVLCYVPGDSRVMQTLLYLIKEQVNDLEVQDMPFFHYLLRKVQPSSITQALNIALPILLESRLDQLDPKDIAIIVNVFNYAVTQKCSANCVTRILRLVNQHPGPWEDKTSLTLLWSLVKVKVSVDERLFAETVQRVLQANVSAVKSCSRKEAEFGFLNLSEAFSTRKSFWYHAKLCDAIASKVVQEAWDFTQASTISRALTKFAHAHIPFLDYFAQLIVSKKHCAADPIVYPFYLLSAFSMANYKPINYQEMLEVVLESPALNSESIRHPWYRLAVDCAVLGCYPHHLLDHIFQRDFLQDFFKRGSHLDFLQLLLLQQSVESRSPNYNGARPPVAVIDKAKEIRLAHYNESPLALPLEVGLGGSQYVVHKVMTQAGHLADHAIVLRQGGYPVATSPDLRHDITLAEDIAIPKDGQLVLVLVQRAHCFTSNLDKLRGFYALESQTLESLGYAILPVALHRWEQLLEHERIPYLMQQLRMIQGTLA